MKNLIFGVIVAFLLMITYAMKQNSERRAPIYNKINNKELVKAIEEFVATSKGTKREMESKFLQLQIESQKDGSYIVVVSYMNDSLHSQFVDFPMVVCAPIAGKKIFVISDEFLNVSPNVPEVGAYFKDDCPLEYDKFIKKATSGEKHTVQTISDRSIINTGELVMHFTDYGGLIDLKYRAI